MRHEDIPESSRAEIEKALEKDDKRALVGAVLAAALYAEDGRWAETVCTRFCEHADPEVRGAALLGFGHIARRHRKLHDLEIRARVERGKRDDDAYVRGQAKAAANDLVQFTDLFND